MCKQFIKSLMTVILCFLLIGCTKKENHEQENIRPVIGVVTKSKSSEYWMTVVSGMQTAADDLDMKVVFLSPDTESKKEVQDRLMESLIVNQIDVLAVSPIDSYSRPDYIGKAKERDIPIVSLDTRFENMEIPYIGIDNELVGYELGKELAGQMGHQGEAGIIAGDLRQSGHRQRVEGFLRYMETEDKIRIVFTESGYANLQMSEKKVKEIFEKYPDVGGIFATSAVTALGIAQEIDGNRVKIVTVDEQKDVIDAVEQGRIAAFADQSGYEIGLKTIQYIDRMLRGEAQETELLLPVHIVTKENLPEYTSDSQEAAP